MYQIEISTKARKHFLEIEKSSPKDFAKTQKLMLELAEHPRTGTGHPEALKGGNGIRWSRAINKKDRLVYNIYDETIVVLVVSARGHYDDK